MNMALEHDLPAAERDVLEDLAATCGAPLPVRECGRFTPNEFGYFAKDDHVVSLNLSKRALTRLPESIGQLPELTGLDLSWNYLEELPASLAALANLTSLNCMANDLTAVPPIPAASTQFTYLALAYNNLSLSSEDAQILARREYMVLALDHNPLTLPPAFGRVQVKYLYLEECGLAVLPATMADNEVLDSLFLAQNQFETVPACLREVATLKSLYMDRTPLASLPASLAEMNLRSVAFDSDLQEDPVCRQLAQQGVRIYGDETEYLHPKQVEARQKLETLLREWDEAGVEVKPACTRDRLGPVRPPSEGGGEEGFDPAKLKEKPAPLDL